MLLEKRDVKEIIKRLKKQNKSCIVGEVILGKPSKKAFSYIKRKRYAVKVYGDMTFFWDSAENILSDDDCLKIAKIFDVL